MILLVEMQCKDWEHNRVNTGIIKLIKKTFPNEKMMLCAEKKHIAQIKELLAADDISVDGAEIDFADWRQGNLNNREKYAELLDSIVRFHKDVTDVMLLSCNKGIVLASSDVSKKWREVRFHVFLHAALEEVCHTQKRSIKTAVWEMLSCVRHFRFPEKPEMTMKACMESCVSDNCRFFVYSPNYEDGLKGKIEDRVIRKITFLHHPFYESGRKLSDARDEKIKIGIYGQAVNRNAVEIIKTYNEKYDNSTVIFQVKAKKENEIFQQKNVVPLFDKDYVSNEELEAAINRFDYVLIPYSQDQYIVTASGIFCDAVSQEKPLLMLNSPYLAFYAKYRVGLIEESVDAIARRIATLKSMNQDEIIYISAEKQLKKISLEENMAILRKTIPLC